MSSKEHVTAQELRRIFEYLPETGQLRRTVPQCGTRVGAIAGNLHHRGYWAVKVWGRSYWLHRLVFLHVHGWLPDQLDHIDGDKSNNRVENLRPCDSSQNAGNAKLMCHNTSGYRGVSLNRNSGKYHANITVFKQFVYLGRFNTAEEAARRYNEAAKIHFGIFARLNDV